MKFSEKLVQLRKQNKLSQEQLADMLDVSRQAVSKWESGMTYPEMDKLLTMCKLFKCSLDELTNDEITTIDFGEKKKSNFIIDTLDMIAKTFEMFKTMKVKQVISCVFSMLLLYFILLLLVIPVNKIIDLGNEVIYFFGPARPFFSAVWTFLIKGAYLVVAVVIFIYIFKVRYLDRFEYVPKPIKDNDKKEDASGKVNVKDVRLEEKELEPQVIYYHEDKPNNFFKVFSTLAIIFIKALIILILIPFILGFLALFAALIVDVILMFKGVIYIGIFLGILFGIILDYIILKLGYDFLFNHKIQLKRIFITFIIGLAGMGIAIGVSLFEVSTTKYFDEAPVKATDKVKHSLKMDNNLFFRFDYDAGITYEIDDNLKDEIDIIVTYNNEITDIRVSEPFITQNGNFKIVDITTYNANNLWNQDRILNYLINDLRHHRVHNYEKLYSVEVVIRTSKANVDILENNYIKYEAQQEKYLENKETKEELDHVNNQLAHLQTEYDLLLEENERLKDENDTLTATSNEWEQKALEYQDLLKEYKEKINNLIEE